MSKILKLNIFIVTIMIFSFFFISPSVYASNINDDIENENDRNTPQVISGYYHAQCDYGNGFAIDYSGSCYDEFYIESTDYYEFMEVMNDYNCLSITFNIEFVIYRSSSDSSLLTLYAKNWDTNPNYYDYETYYIAPDETRTYYFTFNMSSSNLSNKLCLMNKSYFSGMNCYLQSTDVYVHYNTYNVTTNLIYNGCI